MPTDMIKNFADKTNKSVEEVEKLWDEAQTIAGKKIEGEGDDFYAYTTGILKNMLGISESVMSSDFLKKVEARINKEKAMPIVRKKKVTLNHVLDIPNLWILNIGKGPVSKAVNLIAYHNKSKSLFIDFNNRNSDENWYHYKNVPLKVFQQLTEASSKGRFIVDNIKERYESERV